MTEQQWLTSTDAASMLWYIEVGSRGSVPMTPGTRKLRMFAAAAWLATKGLDPPPARHPQDGEMYDAACRVADGDAKMSRVLTADNPVFVLGRRDPWEQARHFCYDSGAGRKAREVVSALLRDVVGNPWRPVVLPLDREGRWHAWLSRTVVDVGLTIYDECRWGELPVLADALEDAGCPAEVSEYGEVECVECEGAGELYGACHADDGMEACDRCEGRGVVMGDRLAANPLLDHLRAPGPHVRGCWALDLVLGKA